MHVGPGSSAEMRPRMDLTPGVFRTRILPERGSNGECRKSLILWYRPVLGSTCQLFNFGAGRIPESMW